MASASIAEPLPARTVSPLVLVTLLTAAFTLSYIDRNLLSLLVTPIKASLALSDTQIGVLQGISFSLFYVVASLPLAWLSDRGNRPKIMAWCIAAWSAMTMVCGLASSFMQLMVARFGVAIGEAGLPPAALTLMADELDRKRLPRATSIFMLAPFLGGGLVLILGGPLFASVEGLALPTLPGLGLLEPWQAMFIIIGFPGFFLALVIVMVLREPAPHRAVAAAPSIGPLIRLFVSRWRLFSVYTLAISLAVLLMNAHIAWLPTALIRAYGIDVRVMGLTFGPVYLFAGAAGTIVAGLVVSRASENTMMLKTLRFMRLCAVGLIVPAVAAPLAPTLTLNLVLLALTVFLISGIVSMGSIPMQIAMPTALRGQAIATTTLAASLIGTGIGPVLVGVLSDTLSAHAQPLSMALAIIAAGTVPAIALLMTTVIRHVEQGDAAGTQTSATLP